MSLEAYGLLKDLLWPELPSKKIYEELKKCLIEYHSP